MKYHKMQHYNFEIDDFICGTWIISQSHSHTQSLCYDNVDYSTIGQSKKLRKHFVYVLGARPQHGADQEYYEEGNG